MRLYSAVVGPDADRQSVAQWVAEKTDRFPPGARFRISIELVTPEPTTTKETDNMPRGRKVSPWRHYTERSNARHQDERFWTKQREEQNRRIKAARDTQREAQRNRDENASREAAERERKEREARRVTTRSINRAREDQRKLNQKASRARDETGRRGGGGEPKTKRWGGW